MMAITTKSSTNVNPRCNCRDALPTNISQPVS